MRSTKCRNDAPALTPLLIREHLSDDQLEHYYMGIMVLESELTELEEHLLWCTFCVKRAEETQNYVDAMRVACFCLERGCGVMAAPINLDSRLVDMSKSA